VIILSSALFIGALITPKSSRGVPWIIARYDFCIFLSFMLFESLAAESLFFAIKTIPLVQLSRRFTALNIKGISRLLKRYFNIKKEHVAL
jgi:hypothetical protein